MHLTKDNIDELVGTARQLTDFVMSVVPHDPKITLALTGVRLVEDMVITALKSNLPDSADGDTGSGVAVPTVLLEHMRTLVDHLHQNETPAVQ